MTVPYNWPMRWMRRRGDQVTITTGKYAGRIGAVESNVYQRTVDYPDEWANGFHIWLDSEELVTVRLDQVDSISRCAANAMNICALTKSPSLLQKHA